MSKKISNVIALLSVALAGFAVQGCYTTEPPPDPRSAAQKAEGEWFNKKAKETNGNFDSLTPEEKQRAITYSRNSEKDARTGFGFASKAK